MPKTSPEVLEARQDLDLDGLAAGALGKAIAALGKSGVAYSEARTVSAAKKDKAKLQAAKKVLHAFFSELGARHMTKTQLKNMLAKIVRANESMKVKDIHVESWTECMACRYRNLLGYANQMARFPEHQKRLPKWFKNLRLPGVNDLEEDGADDDEDGADDDEDGEDDDGKVDDGNDNKDAEDDDDDDDGEGDENNETVKKPAAKSKSRKTRSETDAAWIYLWNDELNLPTRQQIKTDGTPNGPPEAGLYPEIPKSAKDDDEVIASFVDGNTGTIAGKTWGELRKQPKTAAHHEQGDS